MATMFEDLDKELAARMLLFQRFEAVSARNAWLDVSLLEHPGGGYLIMQRSGPAGSINSMTTWFSWTLPGAMTKYQSLVSKRLKKRVGRIYSAIPTQPDLFQN